MHYEHWILIHIYVIYLLFINTCALLIKIYILRKLYIEFFQLRHFNYDEYFVRRHMLLKCKETEINYIIINDYYAIVTFQHRTKVEYGR